MVRSEIFKKIINNPEKINTINYLKGFENVYEEELRQYLLNNFKSNNFLIVF